MRRVTLFLALALLVPASPSSAQEKVYPALEEPMHKPVFHNDLIDVYDVQLRPGQASEYHRHSRDQLGISLRSGTSLNQALGAVEAATVTKRGSISYIPHSVSSGYTHRVRATDTPFRVIGIEFAKAGPAGSTRLAAAPNDPELVFPQGKIARVAVAPGASLSLGGSLIVAVTPGALTLAGGCAWTFAEGSVRWTGKRDATTYRNGTAAPVELLALTLTD
jgi:hypothetical protein